MDATILKKIADKYGQGIADAAALYEPAVKRLTLEELTSFVDKTFAQNDVISGSDLLRSKMNPEELTVEKQKLAVLTALMADQNSEKYQLGVSIFNTVLKAALSAVLL
jgi:hypothetical protein